MLLIDGIKYQLWIPPTEDEFESIVKEHIKEIFGDHCIYLDKKQKLKSLSGIGSIPDGLAIILRAQPELHIVEYELSNHDVYAHIVSQISKFINGLLNSSTRQKIARIIYDEVCEDPLLKIQVEQALQSSEIFKFSTELLDSKPILTIIIENTTEELKEALKPFSFQNIKDVKLVEFQTYTREGVGLQVHAHSFNPLYDARLSRVAYIPTPRIFPRGKPADNKTTELSMLLQRGILQTGQKIFKIYKGKEYEAEILESGIIKLKHSGKELSSLSMAATEIAKCSINGWRWWRTRGIDGKEYSLDELRVKNN